jgi:hypothetical protein
LQRFIGDAAKSFKHLTGAANIMKTVSSPQKFCSTCRGRSLIEWFCSGEGYCGYMAGYRSLLPLEWRTANITIRRQIPEYQILSPVERKSRLLADLWAQHWIFVYRLLEIVSSVRQGRENPTKRGELLQKSDALSADLVEFYARPEVEEVLETMEMPHSYVSSHEECCPDIRLVPLFHQFPPSALFRLITLGFRLFIKSTLYPSLRADDAFDNVDPSIYAIESCRTFAGIEHQMDSAAVTFPCFAAMVLCSLEIPECVQLRSWMIAKFCHFEKEGQMSAQKVRESLSTLWDMPSNGLRYFRLLHESNCEVEEVLGGLDHVHISVGEADQ